MSFAADAFSRTRARAHVRVRFAELLDRSLAALGAALGAALMLAACAPAGTAAGSAAPARATSLPPGGYATIERDALAELNAARTDPGGYARRLEQQLPYYQGNVLRRPGDAMGIATREGPAAVREAATALRATPRLAAVTRSAGMSSGAADLVADHGPRGVMGHIGSDGSTMGDRVNRYGRWHGRITESISFGPATGADVIMGLLVDDGVRDRGHRKNLLDPGIGVAGIACGRHVTYAVMCVIDLAAGYEER